MAARVLLIAAAAMLAADRGALGSPEARAPLSLSDCAHRLAAAPPPSAQLYQALMP